LVGLVLLCPYWGFRSIDGGTASSREVREIITDPSSKHFKMVLIGFFQNADKGRLLPFGFSSRSLNGFPVSGYGPPDDEG
jgi:hypothetical protein